MQITDWILLAVVLTGGIRGWRLGLLRQIVSLGAFFIGFFLAKVYYTDLGGLMLPMTGGKETVANMVAFVVIWVCVVLCMDILSRALTSVLNKLLVLGTVNQLFGALLGVLEFALVIGAVLWFVGYANLVRTPWLDQSHVATALKKTPAEVYQICKDNGTKE